jgi:hypothetical protein
MPRRDSVQGRGGGAFSQSGIGIVCCRNARGSVENHGGRTRRGKAKRGLRLRRGWCRMHMPGRTTVVRLSPYTYNMIWLNLTMQQKQYSPLWRDDKGVLLPNKLALRDLVFRDESFAFYLVEIPYFDFCCPLPDIEGLHDPRRWVNLHVCVRAW